MTDEHGDEILKLNQKINELKLERMKFEEEEKKKKAITRQKLIDSINERIEVHRQQAEEYDSLITRKMQEIDSLEQQQKDAFSMIEDIEKERCPLIGHSWVYDWETHDEGGSLEEHCEVCGTWRVD